jgi:hypothetical protein
MLAALAVAGATTLAFKTIKPNTEQQGAAPAQPLDPAILHMQLQRSRDEMALP